MIENGYSYTMNLLICIGQGVNAILADSRDETLSSRIYRKAREAEERGQPRLWCDAEVIVNALFFWDESINGEGHCQLANVVEMIAGHLPKAMTRQMLLRCA